MRTHTTPLWPTEETWRCSQADKDPSQLSRRSRRQQHERVLCWCLSCARGLQVLSRPPEPRRRRLPALLPRNPNILRRANTSTGFSFSLFATRGTFRGTERRSMPTAHSPPREEHREKSDCPQTQIVPPTTPAFVSGIATEHTIEGLLALLWTALKRALCQISPWQAVAG